LFSGLIDCASIDELINKHEAVNDRYLRVSIVIDEQESESLGAKVITYSKEELGSFYSFNSHSNWSRSKIDLKAYTTTANFQRTQALNFSGLNLESARTEEFLFLLTYKYLELKNWNPSITPFPNYKVAEEEYRAKCQAEIDNCKSSGEAVAVYRKYGKYFCFTNGYSFNENISSINSSGVKIRDIYSAGAGNAIRFISIDVENGGFELCDSDGTHLGSFGWNGTKISDAKISTHSIRLSK
jgi:hypothetical protein